MAKQDLTTPEEIRKLLKYAPDTGKLYWRARTPDIFNADKCSAERACATWNTRYAGKEAFTGVNRDGYRQGRIFSRYFKAHRVAWAIYYGEWPVDQLDHINGVKDDNRIENLRSVSNSENLKNQKLRSSNTSGHMGVTWRPKALKWTAQITINNRQVYLGVFTKKDDAIAARKAAEIKYGYHPNHGRV